MNLQRLILIAIIGAGILTACTTPTSQSSTPIPGMICESFESLSLGAEIAVGTAFQPTTMDIGGLPFSSGSGVSTVNGFARIEDGGLAGGTTHELNVNNIMLGIGVGTFGQQSLQRVQLLFGEYGGTLNISINNELVVFEDFIEIDGTRIGGVTVNLISGGNGNDAGQIEFIGEMIDQGDFLSGLGQFAIGGQELYIDNICYISKPFAE